MTSRDHRPRASRAGTRPRTYSAAGAQAPAAAAFVAVLLVLAPPALADDVAALGGERRRLEVTKLVVEELDRGWRPMVADLKATQERFAEAPEEELRPLRKLRDDGEWDYAQRLDDGKGEEDEDFAYGLFDRLSKEAVEDTRRREGGGRALAIEVRRGEAFEKAGQDDEALDQYMLAARRGIDERPAAKVTDLGIRQGEGYEQDLRFDDALARYTEIDEILAALYPDPANAQRVRIAGQRTGVLDRTGTISFRFVGSAAAFEKVRGEIVDLRTRPVSLRAASGRSPPGGVDPSGDPVRVLAGDYAVRAGGSGDDHPVSVPVSIPSSSSNPQGATATLPTSLPENMSYVPASAGLGAFLIDRFEVRVSQFAEFARAKGVDFDDSADGDLPASGMSFEEAEQFATSWSGKALPTLAQWQQAAFGGASEAERPYPWGQELGSDGVQFVCGPDRDGPASVESCPDGESEFGVRNLAGNVWEWLDDRWAIGGHFVMDDPDNPEQPFMWLGMQYADASGEPWDANVLRQPIPSAAALEALSPDKRKKFLSYTFEDERPYVVGLRCVIALE